MATARGTLVAGWMMAAGVVVSILGLVLSVLSILPGQAASSANWSRLTRLLVLAGGGGLVLFGAALGLLGLTLYVLVPAFSGRERALKDYGSHRVILASTALAAVAGNLLALLYFIPVVFLTPLAPAAGSGIEMARRLTSPTSIAVAAASLDVALMAVVYLRIVRPRAITWSTMGLNLHHLKEQVPLGLAYGIALFGVSSLLELLLARAGIQQTQNITFQSVARASLSEFGLVLLAGAVVAPVAEEIYFRGYVFRAYLEQKGLWRALLFSSGLFAVVHMNLPALLPIFAMGIMLSSLYYRTGSIVPAIIAHALNNAAAFTLLYLGLT